MKLNERDKKIVTVLPLLALIAAYWFLLLAPKRDEKAQVQTKLKDAQAERDTAVGKAAQLEGAKRGFADDYATVLRLGKALPTSVDTPSLLVQLDRAARGTGIEFDKIATGDRELAAAAPPAGGSGAGGQQQGGTAPGGAAPAGGQQGGGAAPAGAAPAGGNAAPGGAPAQTAPGQATEAAGNTANAASGAAGQPGVAAAPGGSGSGGSGGSGSGSGSGGSGGSGATSGVAGLESVPLDFEFTGSFFDLADFFHRMKRFVRVNDEQVIVRGRLITIDSLKFTTTDRFPQLKAEVKATVYLAPRAQGATAGASPSGPSAPAAPAGTQNRFDPDATGRDGHHAMNALFLDLWHDLKQKRLWPVAVVLLGAIAAVPLILSKPAADPGPPAPAPSVDAGAARAQLPLLELDSMPASSSLESFDPHNPFIPDKDMPKKAGGAPSSAGSAGSGGGNASSAGAGDAGKAGGSGGGATGGSGSGGDSSGGGSGGTFWFTFEVDVKFGPVGDEKKKQGLKALEVLPDPNNPVVVFMGIKDDTKTALFMVLDPAIKATGEGKCEPSEDNCSFIELTTESDQDEVLLDSSRGDDYFLSLEKIERVKIDEPPADQKASDARASRKEKDDAEPFFLPALLERAASRDK